VQGLEREERGGGFGCELSILAAKAVVDSSHGGNCKLAVVCDREVGGLRGGFGVSSLCRDRLLFRASSSAQRRCSWAISDINEQGGIGFVVQGAIT